MREPVTAVTDHAADNLRFIRHAMERGTTYSAVPGTGGAIMGGVGLTYKVTFSQPGSYRYVCAAHPGNMTGRIVVQ